MFDSLDRAALTAELENATRDEAAAAARRLRVIAEMVEREVAEQDDEALYWACDYWDAAAAEVGAAMNIGVRAASREMRIAVALRERFPRVSAMFDQGRVGSRLVSTITWRTHLVRDAEALGLIDAALADRVAEWGPLSVVKLEQSIDTLIDRHDPGARRRTREAARSRDVGLGKPDDASGTASLYGRLFATDAAALRKRLAHLIDGVCQDDPRTLGQRRADALGVLAAGGDALSCQCGGAECPAAVPDARAANTVIYVLAESAAVQAEPDPYLSGDDESAPIPLDERPAAGPSSAVIIGGGVLPTPLLAGLIAAGAAFVRMRDMTCTFPGCDRPAEYCDIDHTTPYPDGVTHPSNTKCLCRSHHLLKTFWVGWSDSQQPDGTVIWTSPGKRTYTVRPGGRLFFPGWSAATRALPPASRAPNNSRNRGAMMPRRKRTRAAQVAHQIRTERALNNARAAQRSKAPPRRG
ncbi:HNH endonuclease signature motif containing protein [Mycolicibacterium sp. CBMA 295]|uniref:HNH endonuclease signature motif containing protein n=1 Tax=Mycolicibacterium sp. CBMA 295 TaxID=2606605 RepID=UPI0012DD8ABD|nr:HNH endonuclease signature motif containing protein [Mycolicibacterium sp. CBMA 295]MUM28014.1 DUF222 domain-containing protein [Mycolicibacterium sp. CBMA 295]